MTGIELSCKEDILKEMEIIFGIYFSSFVASVSSQKMAWVQQINR